MRSALVLALSGLILVGCSPREPAAPPAPTVALGLTQAEIDRAEVRTADGGRIGQVERVLPAGDGKAIGLIVVLNGERPREVLFPITQVRVARHKGRIDVVTDQGPAAIAAMPTFTPDA